jgi:cytochrome c-type biogenesis protein CcmH/NrfF
MIATIATWLLWAANFILIGWIAGQAAANREHRQRRDREQQDSLLRSISQDLASLQREQQRLAARLHP